jgi:two-component system, OmpR family, phosphate regulon sensor histidine kinase PhoR
LRTPLASLLGFVETLQGPAKDDSEARAKFLGIMEVQAKRMARLIDDLLSLSRIELNSHIRPSATIDLSGVVRQITDALKPLARDRDVDIVLDLPTLPALVAGDADELLRVFENLIENAIKYGASGGKIQIEVVAKETNEIKAYVRDFGSGIPPDHLPRLTERFYRVDNAASREAGGTGLGLAIVKHIVLRHGGRLEIESTLGKGSIFKIVLPSLK